MISPRFLKKPRHNFSAAVGFTLIELMVVIVIIGILAAIGMPRYQAYVLQGNLEEAKSYLMEISAKERIYQIQTGSYLASNDEDDLEGSLGVDLKDAANFCFVVRTGVIDNFISTTADTAGFEVWAILNDDPDPNTDVAVYGDGVTVTCTTGDNKVTTDAWVGSDGDEAGGVGRVVVLRYPPTSGIDTVDRKGRTGINLDWVDGISVTDPLI